MRRKAVAELYRPSATMIVSDRCLETLTNPLRSVDGGPALTGGRTTVRRRQRRRDRRRSSTTSPHLVRRTESARGAATRSARWRADSASCRNSRRGHTTCTSAGAPNDRRCVGSPHSRRCSAKRRRPRRGDCRSGSRERDFGGHGMLQSRSVTAECCGARTACLPNCRARICQFGPCGFGRLQHATACDRGPLSPGSNQPIDADRRPATTTSPAVRTACARRARST